ncbi:DUF1311 domain-containing protein [Aureimonas flava]|uniref:DUF1311 domain-containing protein n=1 Tax=Aureimonas flava TaxID=2320271 RepID=A0A3A1WPT7_9HYPH|nr:lysozyme inhibitor LprI family protein [Aureimonas flava]RIY02782.1 DUF1311 domain-containing protein [Aureimonas flava]
MRLAPALAAFLALAAPARAQEVDCTDPQTQTALTHCAAADADAADETLNALYGQVRERLADDRGGLDLLRDAQRAWIAYRDAECAFRASAVQGGSAQPMVEAQCLADTSRARSADLRGYLACEEGDMSCPVPAE